MVGCGDMGGGLITGDGLGKGEEVGQVIEARVLVSQAIGVACPLGEARAVAVAETASPNQLLPAIAGDQTVTCAEMVAGMMK
ncbi:MAG: hypothetical protein ACR2PL_21255 [Dehalococcoidia bacterium]